MQRPLPLSGVPPILFLLVLLAAWITWCIFAVSVVVPLVERHITVYYALTAWVLCILPLLAVGTFAFLRLSAENE